MAEWPWDRWGNRHPLDEQVRTSMYQRIGPPNFWSGNMVIPKPLVEWTRADPMAGTIAHLFLKSHPDTGRPSDRPRYFTRFHFKGYGSGGTLYLALLQLGLLEEKISAKHGGKYAVPAHHLYGWLSLAAALHPDTKDSPCLSRSTLSALPVISLGTLNLAPPVAPPSPPSA